MESSTVVQARLIALPLFMLLVISQKTLFSVVHDRAELIVLARVLKLCFAYAEETIGTLPFYMRAKKFGLRVQPYTRDMSFAISVKICKNL